MQSMQSLGRLTVSRSLPSTHMTWRYVTIESYKSSAMPCGLLPVYKPRDWTSADIVNKVKGIINKGNKDKKNRIKVGHGNNVCKFA
jgi:hypothetical protein